MRIHNRKYLKTRRKKLRNNATLAERHLWNQLKNKQLEGRKFRRQHSIGNYIVDFFCYSEKLIIEIDGETHYSPQAQDYDKQRTEYLESLGFKVVRFDNLEVYYSTDEVLTKIKKLFTAEKS